MLCPKHKKETKYQITHWDGFNLSHPLVCFDCMMTIKDYQYLWENHFILDDEYKEKVSTLLNQYSYLGVE